MYYDSIKSHMNPAPPVTSTVQLIFIWNSCLIHTVDYLFDSKKYLHDAL